MLYVSGFGVGLLKSTDGGPNWSALNDGLVSTDVVALAMRSFRRAVNPHDPRHLIAVDDSGGVYATRDAGATWAGD